MKKVFIKIIKFYRKKISHLKKEPTCKYYPTCSSYALEVVERFGAFKGGIMALWRILRCNEFSNGGIDYPPAKFKIYLLKYRKKSDNIRIK